MEVHLRLLRYFAAVADELSYTRAARRLHVSQPALSKQVQQLEDQLKVRLLDRDSRGVRLTAAGRVLHERLPALFATWAATTTALRDAEVADLALLRVGFTAANTSELVRLAAAEFGRHRPGWRIAMTQMTWADPTALLRSREIDLAFVRHPLPDQDVLDYVDVHSEPRVLALPTDHPLAGREVVDFADTLDETFVPLVPGPWRDYWLCLDRRAGHPVRLAEPVAGPEEWSAAVSAGRGVAVTAASAATFYARAGLTFRPLRGVGPTVIALARRRDDRRAAVDEFARCAVAAVGGLVDAPPARPVAVAPARPAPAAALRVAVSSEDDRLQQQILRSYGHTAIRQTPTDSTRSRVDAVRDGAADVAFVRLAAAPTPDLRHHRLASWPMLLAVPTAHPLASPGAALTPAHLDGQPLAFYHRDQNPWWYDEVLGLLAAHGARPRIVHRGLWAYDVLPEVNAGRALALVGTENAADIALPEVTYRRLDPAPQVHLGLLWRADDPAVAAFVRHAATLTAT